MIIAVFIESFKIFTSAMPCRQLLQELIKQDRLNNYILVLRNGTESNKIVQRFLNAIASYSNWKLVIDKKSSKLVNIRNLLHHKNYSAISVDADIYINFDIDPLGKENKPLVTLLADLSSVLPKKGSSSLDYLGRRIRQYGVKRMSTESNEIVCISKFTENDLVSIYPNIFGKTRVIYNCIENDWFSQKKSDLNDRYSYLKSNKYLIWYGNISPRKNLNLFLSAYKEVISNSKDYPDMLFVTDIQSTGFLKLEEYSNQLNINSKIHFIPFQSLKDLINLVDHSIGLVFPSLYEGFGLPVAETLARGKKVICSKVTALPEIGGEFADYFNPDNLEEMIDKLKELVIEADDKGYDAQKRKNWAKQFHVSNALKEYKKIITKYA